MLDGFTRLGDGAQLLPTVFSALACAGWGAAAFVLKGRHRDRKTAERDHAVLREAIEAMPEGLGFFDREDRLLVWNSRYAELLNSDSDLALERGLQFRDIIEAALRRGAYPEAVGREAAWLEARLAKHRAQRSTVEQRRADGRWLRIEERRAGDGGVAVVVEDITELKEREASLRLMFEGNPVPMWVSERGTLRLIAVNDAAVAHYGYSREQFLELTLPDLYAPEEHEALGEHVRRYGSTQYQGLRFWRQSRADGSELYVRPYVQAISYDGHEATIAAQFDVTASKLAEEAMAQARDEAEAASRAKGEFLANMSHEIRTPLNGVTGVAQVLARTELSPDQRAMVSIIEDSAQTLERLLSDVLDLARVESGRIEIASEPFDLVETVRATAALSELRAREKGVSFQVAIDPAAEGLVRGDAGRLKQILYNLLSNAVKFTRAGAVSLSVGVDASRSPAVFTFSVADTGVGFAPEHKARLFGRFEQADGSITRQFGGTGLGLAISRDLAALMGGSLEAASEPGRGSTFTLALPLDRPEPGAIEPEWEAAPAFLGQAEARPLRVLLAEDHPINRKVVQLMLSSLGVDLTCVENGKEAVEAMATGGFDLVLMDMQMPVMDGLTAIERIREHARATGAAHTPIFTLSANAMQEHVDASLAAGADRHLTKPITAQVLLSAIGEIAERVALNEAA